MSRCLASRKSSASESSAALVLFDRVARLAADSRVQPVSADIGGLRRRSEGGEPILVFYDSFEHAECWRPIIGAFPWRNLCAARSPNNETAVEGVPW
jgi:hypothetical protein